MRSERRRSVDLVRVAALLALLVIPAVGGLRLCENAGQVPVSSDSSSVRFQIPGAWEYSAPLISPEKRDRDQSFAQKDPSVVFVAGRWQWRIGTLTPVRPRVP